MLASYFLSRTLVATLAKYWLHQRDSKSETGFHQKFDQRFQKLRTDYHNLLDIILNQRLVFIIGFSIIIIASLIILFPWLGSDFFPAVDSGQIKLHLTAPTGFRVEETAKISAQVDNLVRQIIPAKELDSIVENIGLPVSGINLSYSNSGTVSAADADLLISLKENHHATADYTRKLRLILPEKFPGMTFSFLPAGMVDQILNFGLPAPIDLQVVGLNVEANRQYAALMLNKVKLIPGVVDAHIQQAANYPQLNIDVDRSFAKELGLTQLDVASNMLISLSGSFQTTPTFWLDTKSGVSYPIVAQTPQYRIDSIQDLKNIPITSVNGKLQILGALSTLNRTFSPAVESHYNVQPVIDIFASVQDRDLGGVAHDINRIISAMTKKLPKGSTVSTRGQMQTQVTSFKSLYLGLLFAVLLVYLLMVVNFQSWIDPFIILMAIPASIAGIAWMLFLTHTSLSVPALMGAIMCMGLGTANSILLVSFARDYLRENNDVVKAALEAGFTRIRPVLMTALAMMIGMLPMALGLGAGGEQNAPLGRAVIGGLIFATIATLFFVPAVFCLVHDRENQ